MFVIKKFTINYFYVYHMKLIFYKFSIIAFFSFLNISQNYLKQFLSLCSQNSLKQFIILGKFINFIFKDFLFFNFLKNYYIIIYSNSLHSLSEFFNVLNKSVENVVLIALCVDGFFLNLFLFQLNETKINLKNGEFCFILESFYVFLFFIIKNFFLCIFL